MHVQRLDHVNIRTHDLAATRNFYVGLLGLREGDRPPFSVPGIWLYDDAIPVIHVLEMRASDARESGSGSIDHVAFRVEGLDEMRERLARLGIDGQECVVPRNGDVQIFLTDPNGVKIELQFGAAETALPASGEVSRSAVAALTEARAN